MKLQFASLAVIITTLPACVALPTGERRAITQAAASQPSSPAEARPRDRDNDAWTIRFVADKRVYNARRFGELQARGRAGDLPVFRKWVRERSTPVEGQPGLTPETRQALQDVFADEIALRMAAYGFTADQVSTLHARGVDVVEALDILRSHVAPLRNAAILAEQVVLAAFVGANLAEDLGDGAGATIRLKVIETLKGDAPVGRIYELRMPAEWIAGQPLASTLKRGDRFFLFPSTARYRHDANLKGATARPARPFLTFNETELITVQGDRVQGTHTTPETSLPALRAELKPLAETWLQVSASKAGWPAFPKYKSDKAGGVRLAAPARGPRSMLLGEWYVTSMAGEATLPGMPAIEVEIGENTISAKSRCIPFYWNYSQSGERMRLKPRLVPVAACQRGLSPWESKFSKAMRSATNVSVRPPEYVTFSGADGVITMRRRWFVGLE